MLFFGGLVVANSIELTRLHERIALNVLLKIGSNPLWYILIINSFFSCKILYLRLLLGFMCITAFLSLWISNTASMLSNSFHFGKLFSLLIFRYCNDASYRSCWL